MTNTIKTNHTFSGQDVRVFAYRDLSKLREQSKRNSESGLGDGAYSESLGADDFLDSQTAAYKGAETFGAAQSSRRNSLIGKNYSEDLYGGSLNGSTKESFNSSNVKPFFELGSLDAISYSSFREKIAIRSLGRSHAIGYTRGARTVAGSMTFNSMQENELLSFFSNYSIEESIGNIPSRNVILDQVEPFNIILLFSNEFGGNSVMQLFNVELASESQRMSVHDLVIQNNMNFYATDIIPMKNVGNAFKNTYNMLYGLASQDNESLNEDMRSRLKTTIDSVTTGSEAKRLLDRSRGLF